MSRTSLRRPPPRAKVVVKLNAPATNATPGRAPMPPRTTNSSTVNDSRNGNCVDDSRPWRYPNSAPASPAQNPDRTKATTFNAEPRTPRAAAAVSLSRSANHARPSGEPSMR